MSKETPKPDNPTAPPKIDINDVEMVFGKPSSPANQRPSTHVINEKRNGKEKPMVHHRRSESEATPLQPLLEPDRDRPKPPMAGPEIDDLDEKPTDAAPYPGIDDGLLEGDKKPEDPTNNEGEHPEGAEHTGSEHTHDDGPNTDDGNWLGSKHGLDETDFLYGDPTFIGNGLHNRFGDERPGSPGIALSIPDVNTYQQKKNLAQGMMDLALLSANANQLRYVLESSQQHPYFYPSLVFITCSIVLQVAVGVGLIMNSRYNVKDEKDICKADKINNMTILGIFLITIVNVFITSFSVATPTVLTTTTAIQQTG